jgi:hypothetical protein
MRTQPVGEYGIEQAQRLLPQRGIPFLLRSGIKLLIPAPGLVDQQIQAACSALIRAAAACTARSSRWPQTTGDRSAREHTMPILPSSSAPVSRRMPVRILSV